MPGGCSPEKWSKPQRICRQVPQNLYIFPSRRDNSNFHPPSKGFAYTYVNTTGRIDHIDYPNGQKTQYAYFDNLGDQRLKQITNIDSSENVISQFDYTYNSVGDIRSWTQANSGAAAALRYDLGYDRANQLRSAALKDATSQATVKQYSYDYDHAGNRKTEQIDSATTTFGYNKLNQLKTQSAGGVTHFTGTVNEPSSVTVNGSPATVDASGHFDGTANLSTGTNPVDVAATDVNGNGHTNHYQVTVPSGASKTLNYDSNGNLVDDGSRTFEWDAANRLVAINYTGTSNRSEFTYDGLSRRVKIVEKAGSTINSTKNLIWARSEISEERDASNLVTRRYYSQGFTINSQQTTLDYFYTRDHLGSLRELTDGDGVVQTRFEYDLYGRRTKLTGTIDADFGFTGHYHHKPSGLALAQYRAYSADFGRWMTRDPLGDPFVTRSETRPASSIGRIDIGTTAEIRQGPNMYGYVKNNPISLTDPSGLQTPGPPPTPTPSCTPPRRPCSECEQILQDCITEGPRRAPNDLEDGSVANFGFGLLKAAECALKYQSCKSNCD